MPARPRAIHHCTSEPLHFFGRHAELALLDQALDGGEPSVVALVGPGGQGKTAIVQHWLQGETSRADRSDGVFFWSFYRGKDSDVCLRELFAYAEGLASAPEFSASYCVDRLLPRLRQERWALVLDGTEVVQHEAGSWRGRFVHPELGRLLEELASEPLPGVVAITTRFPVPTLETRRHARILSLHTLDLDSAIGLLASLGVRGDARALAEAARAGGLHAKAVELVGTWLAKFRGGAAAGHQDLPPLMHDDSSDEERHVARVLAAFHADMPQEQKDMLALATAFRQPTTEARLLEYLVSEPVRHLLKDIWQRSYPTLDQRGRAWLAEQVQQLVDLRLLERVGAALTASSATVLDAHPLVRGGFEHSQSDSRQGARTRAGFLRGRPDRRPPATLGEATEEVELFHAYCDAGLWNEADSAFVALDNPKLRLLAPAFERDLLLRFFPDGDWRRPPLWPGFGRWRSLAICHELLGQFEDALQIYRAEDTPLRGDALIALGKLEPLLNQTQAPHPWQTLWQSYRAHALCLAGQSDEALARARATVPVDIYEWVHIFECLLRLGRLDALDVQSLLYRPPLMDESAWSALARRRMRADWLRVTGSSGEFDLDAEYRALIEAYDRAGLPFERVLTRLGYGRLLLQRQQQTQARAVGVAASAICNQTGMTSWLEDASEAAGGAGPCAISRRRLPRL